MIGICPPHAGALADVANDCVQAVLKGHEKMQTPCSKRLTINSTLPLKKGNL